MTWPWSRQRHRRFLSNEQSEDIAKAVGKALNTVRSEYTVPRATALNPSPVTFASANHIALEAIEAVRGQIAENVAYRIVFYLQDHWWEGGGERSEASVFEQKLETIIKGTT